MFVIKRFFNVLKYGWKHSKVMANRESKGVLFGCIIFLDIIYCYAKYSLWSNEYLKEQFHKLSADQRENIGHQYLINKSKLYAWEKKFIATRKFLLKYTNRKYELPAFREERKRAYQRFYGIGDGLCIEHNVELTRSHYLDGTIKIGKNVLLAKNVFIDYSGHVEIDDNVKLANGVIIESHYRDIEAYEQGRDVNIQTNIHICEGAYIGSRAIILSSCHYIGKHARIGANAVVTKDVPDYALVAGVPAKVIKMLK